jgi:type I restriction enzyme S subunit
MTTEPEPKEYWPSLRLKFCATYNDEVLSEGTDDFFPIEYVEISDVSLVGGITNATSLAFHEAPSRARRKVRSGDILISTVRTYLKAIATVKNAADNLIVSTGFCVVRPQTTLNPSFAGWAARSEEFIGEVVSRSVGVSYPAINASQLVDIRIPVPTLDTQKRIAAFLDEKTARIDTLIAKKKALLERLAEKRQAIITQAVTKGLNPAAPMKDSGIEWLGQIPAHWKIKRLKFVGETILGLTYSPFDVVSEGEGKLVLRSSNIQNGRLALGDNVFVQADVPDNLLLRTGDILICSRNGSRSLIGKNAVITDDFAGQTFGAFMTVYRTSIHRFIHLTLNSELFSYQSGRFMTSTINQLTIYTINDFAIPVPPENEQQDIVNVVNSQLDQLDEIVENIGVSIEKLSEYRATLITAAVTGQIEGLQ